MDNRLEPVRREIASMTSELFGVIGIPFEQTTELQRQLLAAFAFGMAFAAGQLRKLTAPEIHALTITCLIDVFQYSDHQAVAFANDLFMAASDQTVRPTMNAIIHRGINGHRQWQASESDQLRANIEDIFQRLGA